MPFFFHLILNKATGISLRNRFSLKQWKELPAGECWVMNMDRNLRKSSGNTQGGQVRVRKGQLFAPNPACRHQGQSHREKLVCWLDYRLDTVCTQLSQTKMMKGGVDKGEEGNVEIYQQAADKLCSGL